MAGAHCWFIFTIWCDKTNNFVHINCVFFSFSCRASASEQVIAHDHHTKMTSFQGFKGLFGSKKSAAHNNRHISEIGAPTNVVHDIHVGKNAHGELEGKFYFAFKIEHRRFCIVAFFHSLFFVHLMVCAATQMLFLID